jgi:HD-like signal output (HDOD) protein
MTSLSILFVDDEGNILQALKRMLHPHRQQWAMTFCSSGEEALSLLRDQPFDVLVTDIRMPHVDGSRVLFESFLYQPETMRCILSGFADREQTIKVAGTAHQFLSKPCSKDAIESMVLRAQRARERLPQSDIRRAVSRVSAVPCRSSVLRELSNELQQEQPNLDIVVDLIASDIGMSAKIMQLVASSFFGRCSAVFCPREAVTLLGVELIAGLLSEMGIFTPFLSDPEILSIDQLCEDSIHAARVGRATAESQGLGPRSANVAYLANYLRDVGKIVLAHQFPDRYRRVMQLMHNEGLPQSVAEQRIFNATSAAVGGYLLEVWGFPQEVVNEIAAVDAIHSNGAALMT